MSRFFQIHNSQNENWKDAGEVMMVTSAIFIVLIIAGLGYKHRLKMQNLSHSIKMTDPNVGFEMVGMEDDELKLPEFED